MSLDSYIFLQSVEETQERLRVETDPDKRDVLESQLQEQIFMTRSCHFPASTIAGSHSRVSHKLRDDMHLGDESILSFINVVHTNPIGFTPATREWSDALEHRKRGDKRLWKRQRSDGAAPKEAENCVKCGGFCNVDQRTATKSCSVCGECTTWQCDEVSTLDMMWRDSTTSKNTGYSYKRANHMWSWILRIQAKETTVVPLEVVEGVRAELGKMQIDPNDASRVTPQLIRSCLKKLRRPQHYKNVFYLRHKLCGVVPPQMTEKQEMDVMHMFKDVDAIYCQLQSKNRTGRSNMLSYSYVLKQMLMMLGYDEFIPQLTLLKHPDRLKNQEKVWQMICEASLKKKDMRENFIFNKTVF